MFEKSNTTMPIKSKVKKTCPNSYSASAYNIAYIIRVLDIGRRNSISDVAGLSLRRLFDDTLDSIYIEEK